MNFKCAIAEFLLSLLRAKLPELPLDSLGLRIQIEINESERPILREHSQDVKDLELVETEHSVRNADLFEMDYVA